jgi:hypothetical protein
MNANPTFLTHPRANRASLLVLAGVVLLAGCGSDSESSSAAAVAPGPSAKATAKVAELTKGMVGAVSSEKPGAAVSVKFDVKSRPEVGKPAQVEVAMAPQHAGNLMRITYISGPGLAIQPSNAPTEYQNVQPGAVYRHEVAVTPQENGVFYLSVIIQLEAGAEPQVRTFSIPIVVGPVPEQKTTAAPPTDATGQPVQSMPAAQ